MDLSLRGSQINLATRDKPNTPSVKYPIAQRPGSANVHRFLRASPILRRPLSADNRLARSLHNCVRFSENILRENKIRKNKRYISSSSSDILRLLLDEPIKRTWCRRDSDEASECSLGQRICNIASQHSLHHKEDTCDENSVGEDFQSSPLVEVSKHTLSNSNTIKDSSSLMQKNLCSIPNCAHVLSNTDVPCEEKRSQGDFWHEAKPDLPGRVSFSKNDIFEVDVSDFENETQTQPNTPPNNKNDFNGSSKKTVHFRESIDVSSYPTEDSPKCMCSEESSRSSTPPETGTDTAISDMIETKCFCPLSCNSTKSIFLPKDETAYELKKFEEKSEQTQEILDSTERIEAIEQYKDQIADDRKIQLELKMLGGRQDKEKFSSFLDNFLQTPLHPPPPDIKITDVEQNDLSHSKNLNQLMAPKESNKKFDINNIQDPLSISSINNPVINNYLKVAADRQHSASSSSSTSIPTSTNKKQNNLNSSKLANAKRTKSSSTSIDSSLKTSKTKPKKSGNFVNLRQDSNLDEFHMDKVDSWMSLHGNLENARSPADNMFTKIAYPLQEKNTFTPEIDDGTKTDESSNEDSTYDEIVSVIKEIEEEKKKEEPIDAKSDINLKLRSLLDDSGTPDSAICLDKIESPDKLKDILTYLDNVESSCARTLMETRRSIPESSRSEIEFAIEPDIVEDVPKIADLLMLPNHQLARRVVALSLRANELSNAIQLSKEHAKHIRSERGKALRQEKQSANNRVKEQKKHFEGIVARHQGFIEQLLRDKGLLCEKVAALTRRLESQNQAWEHKLETELVRVKEAALAGEKIRRERWVRENTKKIKELTIKGLEMEINKMNTDHQKEVTEIKRQHQQEILNTIDELRLKHEQTENSIRESCAEDREVIIAKERSAIRERFEKQLQDEQKSFDDQKNKLLEDFTSERDRIFEELRQKDDEIENKKHELLKEKDMAVEKVYSEFREKLHSQEQKYQTRIDTIQKQFESDFLIWKREYENACKLREVENENSIRQHYRAERDRQIDEIVARMDAESIKIQEEYEIKINRMKMKYDNDIRDAELSEATLKEKFNETRTRLAESEAQTQNYHADIKQLQIELEHSKRMCNELLDEKEDMKENARKEIQIEITALQTERDNEIQKIYKRVQQAIEKKDASLELLQKDNASLRERCIKLEAIIRQQRKDYCIK